jgi:hypothetical protein
MLLKSLACTSTLHPSHGPAHWPTIQSRMRRHMHALRQCAGLCMSPCAVRTTGQHSPPRDSPSSQGVGASVMKNWLPFVLGPALACTHARVHTETDTQGGGTHTQSNHEGLLHHCHYDFIHM